MTLAVASSGRALWYLTRGSGTVALLLLTVSVVLGVLEVRRFEGSRWPRFVLDAVHRYASLLAIVFLVVHILTSVLDGFASISLIDAIIPFLGSYRPFWLGLGAVAFDLMIAIAVTSLLRQRIGYRTWRIVHWSAYASWPVALLHTVGTGTDANQAWLLALSALCLAAMIVAVVVRVSRRAGVPPLARGWALGLTGVATVALVAWMPTGPLAKGWARKAGTPLALLTAFARPAAARSSSSGATAVSVPSTSGGAQQVDPAGSFTASLSGSISQQQAPNGLALLRLSLAVGGAGSRQLGVTLEGTPTAGGVSMSSGQVTLGTTDQPSIYRGPVTALNGSQLSARLSAAGAPTLDAKIALANTGAGGGTVQGTLSVAPAQGVR